MNNLERIKGAGIDPEIDRLCVAMKLNGKLVNKFGVKKAEVGVKNGDVGLLINGGVTCGEVTLKLARLRGVPRPMTLILPRTGAAGIVDLNCIGCDGDRIMPIGIGAAGRAIGLAIIPIGRPPIGRIIIGRGLWAAADVLNEPTSTSAVNGVPNLDPNL